jgi:hypothetical protein
LLRVPFGPPTSNDTLAEIRQIIILFHLSKKNKNQPQKNTFLSAIILSFNNYEEVIN